MTATTAHVLLVNSFDDREMYAEYLRNAGLLVHTAANPEAALTLLATVPCDVAITDLVFASAGLGGASFTRELRARLDPATSIIVVSGCVRQEDREAARQAGADLFLIKPALPSAVLFEVRRALVMRRHGRRLPWNWRDAAPARTMSGKRHRSRAS